MDRDGARHGRQVAARRWLPWAAALWTLAGCGGADGGEEPGAAADAGTVFRFGDDAAKPPEDAGQGGGGDDAVGQRPGSDVLGDAISSAVTAVQLTGGGDVALAASTPLVVAVQRTGGEPTPPQPGEELRLHVNGQEVGVKGWIAPNPEAQPPIALWPGPQPGSFEVVGVRPGQASLSIEVEGVSSGAVVFTVGWPEQPQITVRVPGAAGSAAAEQKLDANNTVKLGGDKVGAGGLAVTLRFPASAKAGDAFDLGVKPASGGLSLQAKIADLAGTKYVLAKGVIWIDQVDAGLFRGTFLGLAANLKPMAGVFVVQRTGKFGVDMLGPAVQLAKSDSLLPASGHHHSRAAVHEAPGGKALVTWRHIENLTMARIERVLVDPVTGQIDTSLPPLVDKANAYQGSPDVFAHAVSRTAMAESAGRWLIVWEGRDGKGSAKPHQLWGRIFDEKNLPLTAAFVLSSDLCDGKCRPQVRALPSSRWIVVWSGPKGGVRSRRVAGNISGGLPALPSPAAGTLDTQGKGATVATWQNNVLVGWWRADKGPVWRMFGYQVQDDKLKSAMDVTAFGAKSLLSPPPAVVALLTPSPPPNLLFVGAWQEQATATLSVRRIAVDGTALGVDSEVGDGAIASLTATPGKGGQVLLLDVPVAKTGTGIGLRVRKVGYGAVGDSGTPVGLPVTLSPPIPGWKPEPAICYISAANVYVAVWSGDLASGGVWMRRFR